MPGPKLEGAGSGKRADADTDEEDGDGGLTDLDCYNLLSSSGMGGRNGFTVDQYIRYSDRRIIALVRPFIDKDGDFISEWDREQERHSSRIETAARDLPSFESIGWSDRDIYEALAQRPGTDSIYLGMFAQVWGNRGLSKEQIQYRWRNPPKEEAEDLSGAEPWPWEK